MLEAVLWASGFTTGLVVGIVLWVHVRLKLVTQDAQCRAALAEKAPDP